MNAPSQRLGRTRAGKVILQPWIIDEKSLTGFSAGYTDSDHFDAHSVCEYLISWELLRIGTSSQLINKYQRMSRFYDGKLTRAGRDLEMERLRLTTILDVIQHGKRLADRIFIDHR